MNNSEQIIYSQGSASSACQNCAQEFVIEPEDFDFYTKIQVPAPTFCPECRARRRLLWRNERVLYKRKCQAPGHTEELISMYAPDKKVITYDQKYWWSDEWDPRDFGSDYDFSKPFFKQFQELFSRVPLLAVSNSNATNSDYCNVADQSKDCYLCSGSYKIERAMYSNRIYTSKDCLDLYVSFRNELCYDCISCTDSYNLRYSLDSIACRDSYFLYDCRNCSDCVGCTNLRNKQYCIFNQQYPKDEYKEKVKELSLDTFSGRERVRQQFEDLYRKALHRFAQIQKAVDCTGDHIDNAKNAHWVFDVTEGLEDAKYCHWGGMQTKDVYDAGPGIGDVLELGYEIIDSGLQSSNIAFTNVVYGSENVRYSLYCHGSHNLFGCIGLRSKKHCILNKQYSKEEYEELIPKIRKHMDDMPYVDVKGRIYKYGEFFPEETAPMAINESIAQDYFPLSSEEIEQYGYTKHTAVERTYKTTMCATDLPGGISDVDDSIMNETIECEHKGECDDGCSTAFRIIKQELDFYRRLKIPLPRTCFNCRHVARLKKRNPMHLWPRQCMCKGQMASGQGQIVYENTTEHFHGSEPCPNEFQTSYAPERKEIVYCESCYNAEVA